MTLSALEGVRAKVRELTRRFSAAVLKRSICDNSARMNPKSDQTAARTIHLREGLRLPERFPDPCTVVIFGATGDLTHRKLIPALYNIAADGELPPGRDGGRFRAAPKDGRGISQASWRRRRGNIRDRKCAMISGKLRANRSSITRANLPIRRATRVSRNDLDKIDQERRTRGNRLFYLAASPEQFETDPETLEGSGVEQSP